MKKIIPLILVFTSIIVNGQEKTAGADVFSVAAAYDKAKES